MAGIVGYGAYVPRLRIKSGEIASIWNEDPDRISKGLLIEEKTVPNIDEDCITIASQTAKDAVRMAAIDPQRIGAIYVGSESHPYAVKSSAATVAEYINAVPNVMAADLEFACKAGTAGMQIALSLVKSKMVEYAMGIGADTSQGRPGDALEYSAAAGGAAYLMGDKNVIAEINDTCTFTTDTPDFWRREGEEFPRHAGRFTGEPAYFKHSQGSAKLIMEKCSTCVEDYDYFVFHQPNGKFPLALAKRLGVPKEKVMPGLLVTRIGNTYSGATPLGLAATLDIAKAGDRILAVSYGSGSGSDAFDITVTDELSKARERGGKPLEYYISKKEYVTYGQYAKLRKKLKGI